MSREPAPELRAVAARLFDACRTERPTPELERRVLARAAGTSNETHDELRRARPGTRRTSAPGRWLIAALVLALPGVALWRSLGSRATSVVISAEQRPAAITQHESPLTQGAEPPLPEPAPPPAIAPAPARARPGVKTPTSAAPSSAPPAVISPDAIPAPPKASLAQDVQNLMHIRATLRSGDSATALELLDRRARESRNAELDAEATLLRIEALASAGRRAEATALAQRFVRANPNNALAERAKQFMR